ncbi:MAG: Cupin 2, conserved barrel domain protein [Nocardioidaceae bacterium]|nr:Cupin 2, conserved barrel domain protein [Nocardioidaceae bacterium]
MSARIQVYGPGDWEAADPTSGMARERAFEVPGLWAGRVTTAPGAFSGWHHHSSNESSLYVVSGVLRLECEGVPGYVDAEEGMFVHVPAHTVHRESNPTGAPSVALIARAGTGVPTVNVDHAPEPHG